MITDNYYVVEDKDDNTRQKHHWQAQILSETLRLKINTKTKKKELLNKINTLAHNETYYASGRTELCDKDHRTGKFDDKCPYLTTMTKIFAQI